MLFHVRHGQVKGLGQSDDAHEVFCSAPHGPFLPAAHDVSPDAQTISDVQESGSLWAVQFVCAARGKIHRQIRQSQRIVPHGLYRIRMEEGPVLVTTVSDADDVLHQSNFIVAVHDGDHRLWAIGQEFVQCVHVDPATIEQGKKGALDAFPLSQMLCGLQYGAVLGGTGQDAFTIQLIHGGVKGHVVRLCSAAGEAQRFWMDAEMVGNVPPGLFDGCFRLSAKGVCGGGVAEMIPHVWNHGINDLGEHRSRRSIVEVHVHFVRVLGKLAEKGKPWTQNDHPGQKVQVPLESDAGQQILTESIHQGFGFLHRRGFGIYPNNRFCVGFAQMDPPLLEVEFDTIDREWRKR